MPITLPATLPAFDVLRNEGVMVMSPERAQAQEIRPLRIGLLNLMPKKIQTENQFARLIGATPLQIDFQLIRMSEHQTKNTAADHMETFYRPFQEVKSEKVRRPDHHRRADRTSAVRGGHLLGRTVRGDGLDANQRPFSTFGVCWGGMAMINHFHGVKKHMLDHKAFGCFRHQNLAPTSPFLRGFSDDFVIPVSRWTEMKQAEIDAAPGLRTLLGSDQVGPCLVEDPAHRALYIFNHFEYDSDTLKQEYDRDVAAGTPINVPDNYYPNDNPALPPLNRWRSHAHLLYGNWINEIYQSTPYDMAEIGR